MTLRDKVFVLILGCRRALAGGQMAEAWRVLILSQGELLELSFPTEELADHLIRLNERCARLYGHDVRVVKYFTGDPYE